MLVVVFPMICLLTTLPFAYFVRQRIQRVNRETDLRIQTVKYIESTKEIQNKLAEQKSFDSRYNTSNHPAYLYRLDNGGPEKQEELDIESRPQRLGPAES